ncbi:MAG TPA: proteasome subunit beta [Nitrospiria bacterium]
MSLSHMLSHGTTILAIKYSGGAVIAGDRRATEGYQISDRRIEKVYSMDSHTAIAIAGAAGPCIDMARLFRTELEHYEKVEGSTLSTEGKANKLAQMIKGNLPLAAQGLVVIPIFVGFDEKREEGRIFKYDIAGGRYEETDYYSTGSGGKDARNTLKKVYRSGMDRDQAVSGALEALYDAAEEDAGTGGPDLVRGIFPTVKTITTGGIEDIPEDSIRGMVETLIESRKQGG